MRNTTDTDLNKFTAQFLKEKNLPPDTIDFQPLAGDGSERAFRRMRLLKTLDRFIVMSNPPVTDAIKRENLAYVMIGNHLRKKGVPVPLIHKYNLKRGWFIMEDLGQTHFQDVVLEKKDPLPDYETVLEHLFHLQIEGIKGFDPAWCCQTQIYDRTVMRENESNYFRDAFLCNYLGLKKAWPELETAFDHLADKASQANNRFFLHRDFQSRNIMVSEKGDMGIIDWQGGRLGPLGYDLASLIIDPYARLSPPQRDALLQSYLLLIRKHDSRWESAFKKYFVYLAIQRNMQILGAFAHLTKVKNKPYFKTFIPAARKSLSELLYQAEDTKLLPLIRLMDDIREKS